MTSDELRRHLAQLWEEREAAEEEAREWAARERLPPAPEPEAPLVPRWVVVLVAVLLGLRALILW